MRSWFVAIVLLHLALSTEARDWGEDRAITIWSNDSAPHSNNLSGDEVVKSESLLSNTTTAELLIYEAKGEKKRDFSVMICPGGGYSMLSMTNGGQLIAEWLAESGITAAVLKYRLPNGVKEVPYEDAMEGLRLMRREYRNVGVLGLSAGGHLAAMTSTKSEAKDRPAFSILFFPVISAQEGLINRGSFDQLLGKGRSEALSMEYSLELLVDEHTPPAFILLSDDDTMVDPMNSTLYYNALHQYNKSSALYIFPYGKHGWGFSDRVDFKSTWQKLMIMWLDNLYKE